MLAPTRTVAPTATPVTLVEAKAHLRVDFADDDTLITALIAAAIDHFDGWSGVLGRALVTQTWTQDFPTFGSILRLPLAPVASISTVTYYNTENAQQTLAGTVYGLFVDAIGPYVYLKPDQTWPATHSRADAVKVTFVAGLAVGDVPPAIKAAILLLIGHLYENREAVVSGESVTDLPYAINALTSPYRRIGV